MGSNSWINGPALSSGRLNKYFRWAAWAELAIIPAFIFMWYCYYLTLKGSASPLQYLSVRILLGSIGAAGAFGSILLSKGMWAYWKQYDTSPERTKRFWFWAMTLFILFGASAYYHLVFRPQVEGRGLGRQ